MKKKIIAGWVIKNNSAVLWDSFARKRKESIDVATQGKPDRAKAWRDLTRKQGFSVVRAVQVLKLENL